MKMPCKKGTTQSCNKQDSFFARIDGLIDMDINLLRVVLNNWHGE